jgi:hypothetical protein
MDSRFRGNDTNNYLCIFACPPTGVAVKKRCATAFPAETGEKWNIQVGE